VQIGNDLTGLNTALSNLYLQPHRMSELLMEYEKHPTHEMWKQIKSHARKNEEMLIKIYNAIEALGIEPFFRNNPCFLSGIETIVEKRSVEFYSVLHCYPEEPFLMDQAEIHDLLKRACDLDQQSQEKLGEFQIALTGLAAG